MMEKCRPASTPRAAPFTDEKSALPHYQDVIDPEVIKPSARPTRPNAEPMAAGSAKAPDTTNAKLEQLAQFRTSGEGRALTTSDGVKVADNQNTLKAGTRGPSLLEDFHFTDKMAHFDRERIPERVVHARGSGAHGYFQVYESQARYTKAAFLQDPRIKTPVFVRFSSVQGFRGSADTVRDIRGFATKFYTSEGNFDLVGNDTPVFFIQDAIKFPDFVHAVKPEPGNEVPQGQSAHDSFWDYVSLQPETLHNVLWQMSDRGIPRSFRTIEGFGIHSYRLINAKGQSCFARFHWKPVYGTTSLIWDEAQALTGRDPDFLRKDLWQGIEAGDYPEFELGLQIVAEEDADRFDFDILDATKLIPEALVPVTIVGRMVLNRNPDNFFAETEQVAFCPANIVPGIDFSEDPLLLGRVFSYADTQRHRLGTANFNEIPINRPLVPVRNQQRDGFFRSQIDTDAANYKPNSIGGNWPRETAPADKDGGFASHAAPLEGKKERRRSPSFADYYSQPRLFWLSQTPSEQRHIIQAFCFELGKVMRVYIRERVVDLLTRIDPDLARGVADGLGIRLSREQLNRELPGSVNGLDRDPALSLYANGNQTLKSRRAALLVADGVNGKSVDAICEALKSEGVHPQIFAPRPGMITTAEGEALKPDGSIEGNPSVLVDAVLVPDGEQSVETLMNDGNATYYLRQAYKHLKAIGLAGEAKRMLKAAGLPDDDKDPGLLTAGDAKKLMKPLLRAMSQHRVWEREARAKTIAA
ncbi:MAG: catalase HPII [Desulfovibrionaceae bacterium]|nr:catalase HPII [Desulfovibrionaceae bacterium]